MYPRLSRYIWLISLAFLGACSSGNEQPELSQANFDLPPIEVVRTSPSGQDELTGLANRLEFTIKVCPLDIAQADVVRGQDFRVTGAVEGVSVENTGSVGCFQLTDSIDFSATSKESYCQRNYTVEGLTPYSGAFQLPIGINPLRTGSSAIVDLRHDKSVKLVGPCGAGVAKAQAEAKLPLKMDFLAFELAEESHGADFAELVFNTISRPKFMPLTEDATALEVPQGDFVMDVTILEKKQLLGATTVYVPLAKAMGVPAKVDSGMMQAKIKIRFNQRLPQQQADLLAHIEIRPASPTSPFAATFFKAGFKWENRDFDLLLQESKKSYPMLVQDKEYSVLEASILSAEADESPVCRQNPHAFGFIVKGAPTFHFDANDLKNVRRESRAELFEELEDGKPLMVKVDVEVCLQDSLYGSDLEDHQLKVGIGEPGKAVADIKASSLGDGCVRFESKLPQAVFLSTEWLEQELVIESRESKFAGVQRKLSVYVRGNSTNFGQSLEVRDCLLSKPSKTYTIASYVEQIRQEIKAEVVDRRTRFILKVPKIELKKWGADYQVDSDLNLYAHPRFRIEFAPIIDDNRRNSIGSLPKVTSHSRVRVRTIFAQPINAQLDETKLELGKNLYVMSSSESILNVDADQVARGNIFAALNWKDIPTMKLRTYMIIEVQLLDELAEIPPYVGYINMDLMAESQDEDTYPIADGSSFQFPNLTNARDLFHEVKDLPKIVETSPGTKIYRRFLPVVDSEIDNKAAFFKAIDVQAVKVTDLGVKSEDHEEFRKFVENRTEEKWLPKAVSDRLCLAYFGGGENTVFGDILETLVDSSWFGWMFNDGIRKWGRDRGSIKYYDPSNCMKDPRRFLALKRLMFVRKVHNKWIHEEDKNVYREEANTVLQNDESFKLLETETQRFIRGVKNEIKNKTNGFIGLSSGGALGGNGNFGFENEFMIHAGSDWVSAVGTEYLTRSNSRSQSQFMAYFNGVEKIFKFEADVEYCTYVRLRMHENQKIREKDPGVMFCTETLERREINESWFYISRAEADSNEDPFAGDLYDRKSNVWSNVIRGIGRIDYVANMMRDKSLTILLRQNRLLEDLVEFRDMNNDPHTITYGPFRPDRFGDGSFPGIIEYY